MAEHVNSGPFTSEMEKLETRGSVTSPRSRSQPVAGQGMEMAVLGLPDPLGETGSLTGLLCPSGIKKDFPPEERGPLR